MNYFAQEDIEQLPRIVFFTGASGVGKSTTLFYLKNILASPPFYFFHYDEHYIPTVQEMNDNWGSSEKWQEEIALDWVQRTAKGHKASDILIFGRIQYDFIVQLLLRPLCRLAFQDHVQDKGIF